MKLRKGSDESGFVLVTVGIFLIALLGLAGFAVDLGSWYLQGSKLQRAADAAALAAVQKLPDTDAATAEAATALANNGFVVNANGITMTTDGVGSQMEVKVKDSDVPTYFIKMIKPSITITRTAHSVMGSKNPALGSPYNVFGGGDLNISGIPKQNFWLAINGACAPKEDGDFFGAAFDGNKGPLSSTTGPDGHTFVQANTTAAHHCLWNGDHGVLNPDFQDDDKGNTIGYSYYVDVPAGQTGVSIEIYDAGYKEGGGHKSDIDSSSYFSSDYSSNLITLYSLFDTHGTIDDESDDGDPIDGRYVDSADSRSLAYGNWLPLHENLTPGKTYRVQVNTKDGKTFAPLSFSQFYGVNAFALGAFKNGVPAGCDVRTSPLTCPRVYGRDSISVYNSLADATTSQVSYYLADIGTDYIGSGLNIYLWDPGEGTKKIELTAPDGFPLTFDWTSSPATSNPGYSGSQVTSIATDGTGPPAQPNLSNNYKFNDRLVKIHLVIPSDYGSHLASGTGMSIRYTLDSSPNDRITIGLSMDDGGSSPIHLVSNSMGG